MSKPCVLITGGAGRLGRAAARELDSRGWDVRSFDRAPAPVGTSYVGQLSDADTLLKAAKGAQVMIHLAATPDDDDFVSQLLPNNVLGLYNALEAARIAGIKRVILASTGQVNWWQQFDGNGPIKLGDTITPRGWYAVTKVAMEAAGMIYARNEGMTVIATRLGWCPRTRAQMEELGSSPHGPQVYFSPQDAGAFFAAAVSAPVEPGYHLVFAASLPRDRAVFDLEPVKALLGWSPKDRWPEGAEEDVAP